MNMVVRWILMFLCLWTFSFTNVSGYCFKDPIKFERTVSGRVRKYCEYKHPPVVNKDAGYVIMFPDSSVFTGDCLACTCTMDGLTCCGFGHQEINLNLPPDCIQLQDGCHGLHVKRSNQSLDCFTGKPISFDTLEPHPDNVFSLPSLVESGSTKVIKVNDATANTKTTNIKAQPTKPTTYRPPTQDIQHKIQKEQHSSQTVQENKQQVSQSKMAPVINATMSKPEIMPKLTLDMGNVPVIQTAKGDSKVPSIQKRIDNIIPLHVPTAKGRIGNPVFQIPQQQVELFPVHDFRRKITPTTLPRKPVSQNQFSTQKVPPRLDVGFQNAQRQRFPWHQQNLHRFATVTPSFYPMPYVDPVREAREDSGSSSSNFNDFLFNIMMFGAFS